MTMVQNQRCGLGLAEFDCTAEKIASGEAVRMRERANVSGALL